MGANRLALSQFDVQQVFATRADNHRTSLQRLSEMTGIKDLLDQYAAGSLYMAEMVGGQSQPVAQNVED